MKILAIGDPHGSLDKIKKIPAKKADLILLTGDIGKADLMRRMAFENIERRKKGMPEKEYSHLQQKKAFLQAYNSSVRIVKHLSKFAPVYIVFGNVETSNSETKKLSKKIKIRLPMLEKNLKKMKNVSIINNKFINFSGLRIGGLKYFIDTSWVKEFKPEDLEERMKDARKETKEAKRVLNRFGKIDILLCHQPPYGILDKVTFKGAPKHWQGKHAGSKVILDYIKRQQPAYVFCGHIHEQAGRDRISVTEVYNLGVAGYKVITIN